VAAPLADIGDLEAALGHPVDPVVGNAALTNASGLIRAWCGWHISREVDVTFTTQGNGTQVLALPTMYLAAVHEVRVDGVILDDYAIDPAGGYGWYVNGHLVRYTGWPCLPRSVQVDVDHGYDPVPDAITAVVVALSMRSIENPVGVRQEAVGTVIQQFHNPREVAGDQLNALNAAVLGPFRLPMQP
jgi:hypothetical protein